LEKNMKKLTILVTVLMLALCTSAMAITITVIGIITDGTSPLGVVPGSYGLEGDFENIGVNPLIDIFVNGSLIGQTTVGAGKYVQPVNGAFDKDLEVGSLAAGDLVSITAYLSPDGTGLSATSNALAYNPGEPQATIFHFDTLPVTSIPEPSMLLSGLALLLLRRKK
jgi:hypothetical protein